MGPPVAIFLFVLFCLVLGASLVIGAPVFAIPIVFVVLGVIGSYFVTRRVQTASEMRRFREQAASEPEFTDRDRLTQT